MLECKTGHCKRLVPEYKVLGEKVLADPSLSSRVSVAKVNAESERALAEKFGVRGYPTIKYFPRGEKPTEDSAIDYNGARAADDFLSFLQDKIQNDKSFGRIDAMDPFAKDFVADGADQVRLILTRY